MERRQQQFYALGSQVYITLIAEPNYPFDAKFKALYQKISSFEQCFSRFLPQSELTKFNENAGRITEISQEFKELLEVCQQMAEATDDLYNPFILPALQKAGYKGSWPAPARLADAKDFSNRQIVPAAELKIYEQTAKIPVGTALDLGGIGKGYLLDKLQEFLSSERLHGYWLSLGGDIVCAGFDLEGSWSIQVQNATNETSVVTKVSNKTGSPLFIATSGVTKRRGISASGPWHHLINPKTGKSAITDILTATVTAARGVWADVYAKTIVIVGGDYAQFLQKNRRIYSYVIQFVDKEPKIKI